MKSGRYKEGTYPMQNLAELATQKPFLQHIVENNFQLPEDIEPFALLKALLPNLGSTDEELRDVLNYPIMAHFIVDEQNRYQLTGAQLEELLLLSIDKNHLFYGIGEAGLKAKVGHTRLHTSLTPLTIVQEIVT